MTHSLELSGDRGWVGGWVWERLRQMYCIWVNPSGNRFSTPNLIVSFHGNYPSGTFRLLSAPRAFSLSPSEQASQARVRVRREYSRTHNAPSADF